MRCSLLILFIAACSAPPSPIDAGVDAGPTCTNAPAQSTCVALDTYATICGSSRAATITREFETCDAGRGIQGYLGVGECGAVETVEWTYGFPGDTYVCFFGADGGGLVGAINYSDHGVLAAGTTGECTAHAPPMCP